MPLPAVVWPRLRARLLSRSADRAERFACASSLASFGIACTTGIAFAWLGAPWIALGSLFCALVSLAAMRNVQHPWVKGGHVLALSAYVTVLACVPESGGRAAYAFVIPILAAAPLLSRRAIVGWGAVLAASALVVAELQSTGQLDVARLDPLVSRTHYLAFVSVTTTFTAVVSAIASETTVRDALAAKEQARAELDRQHGQLLEAHATTRALLDTVHDGLIHVGIDGRVLGPPSRAAVRMLGPIATGATIWDTFAAQTPKLASWLELAWSDLATDDGLPPQVILGQLPKRIQIGSRHVELSCIPEPADRPVRSVLVVLSDVTPVVHGEQASREQEQLVAVATQLLRDPYAVEELVLDGRRIVESIRRGGSPKEQRAWIHTLKGNAGVFGLAVLARWLHELEGELADHEDVLSDEQRAGLEAQWDWIERMVEPHLAPMGRDGRVSVSRAELDDAIALAEQSGAGRVADVLRGWEWEPVRERVQRLGDRARSLADRLGKRDLHVEIDCPELRLPPTPEWLAFWAALVHVVRNAIDHGIELPDERRAAAKAPGGQLRLEVRAERGEICLEVTDDGRGIDWDAVARRAADRGLRHATREDRVEALLAGGVTTRALVSDVSGRGLGTSAVSAAARALGGHVEIDSTPGRGTTFRFVVPRQPAARAA